MNTFILLNKPAGVSSAACVARVRKGLGLPKSVKAGHTGTLDPFATGLLPIAFGKATKAIPYLPKARKRYRATLKFGEETDTLDNEGKMVAVADLPTGLDRERIGAVMGSFIGTRLQSPPVYSAVKFKGKPLYEYARSGSAIIPPRLPREITIYTLECLGFTPPTLEFEVACSGGTYVRVLGQELAQALGTVGHLVGLSRLESDGFSLDRALAFDDLGDSRRVASASIPIPEALRQLSKIELESEADVQALRQGKIEVLRRPLSLDNASADQPILVTWREEMIAVMRDRGGDWLEIERIF